MVAGLISAELYKIAAGCQDIEKYRNTFMNLALPVYSFSEPMPAPKVNLFSIDGLRLDLFQKSFASTGIEVGPQVLVDLPLKANEKPIGG